MLWMHHINEGKRGESAPRQLSGRGVAYWTDGREERIVYVTPGYQMIALNAKTGVPVRSFGKNGIVDLKLDDDQQMDLVNGRGRPAFAAARRQRRRRRRRGAPVRRRAEEQDEREGLHPRLRRQAPASVCGSSTPFRGPGEFGNDTWEKRLVGVHRQRRFLGER